MIFGVDLSISAARECQLKSKAVSAVCVEVILGWHDVAVQRRLRIGIVVKTIESKSALLQEKLVVRRICAPEAQSSVREWSSEVSKKRISGNHLEAFWKGFHVLEVVEIVAELQLVTRLVANSSIHVDSVHLRKHAADLRNHN